MKRNAISDSIPLFYTVPYISKRLISTRSNTSSLSSSHRSAASQFSSVISGTASSYF